MPRWSFLTNHAQVLLYLAHDSDARLIDVAAALGITERSAFTIVNDLARAGYVVKVKEGRRNRYEVQCHLVVPVTGIRSTTVEQLLALLVGASGASSSVEALPPVAAAS